MFTKKKSKEAPLEFSKELLELLLKDKKSLFKKIVVSGVSKKINIGICNESSTLDKDLELIVYGYSILPNGGKIDCSINFKYVGCELKDSEDKLNLGHVIISKLIDSKIASLEAEVFIDSLEWLNQILDSFYSQKTDIGVPVISMRANLYKKLNIDKTIKDDKSVWLKLERFWFESMGVFNREALSKNVLLKRDLS